MVLFIYLGVICIFLISKVQAQNTSNFLALLNLDDQNITCITSDTQKAMTIIYPLEDAIQVKEKENKRILVVGGTSLERQSNLKNTQIPPTMIFDERWNDFNNSRSEYTFRSNKDLILPMSIRGNGSMDLYFFYEKIPVCKLSILESRSEMYFYNDGRLLETKSIHLTMHKWTTFMLKFSNTDKKNMSLTYKLENGKEELFGNGTLPNEFQVSKVEIITKNTGYNLARIHEFEYFYWNVEANQKITINSTNSETCFTIYTALCSTCGLTFSYNGQTMAKISKPNKNDPLWKINTLCLKNNNKNFDIDIKTWTTEKTNYKELFWAISLNAISEFKSFSIKYKSDSESFKKLIHDNQFSCQIIGEPKEIRINSPQRVPDDVEECPSPVTFGPNCSISCETLYTGTCFGTRLFTSTSQVCPAGYTGLYCKKECNEIDDSKNHFGQNCKHKCGKCKEKCNSITGNCESNRAMEKCESGYAGDKCDINEYPTVYNKPALNVINSSSIEVILKNISYFGFKKPHQYQLQYRIRAESYYNKNWNTYNKTFNMSYDKSIILSNLKAATQYDVRIILLDAEGNGNLSESVPFNTEKTPCTDITEINIKSFAEDYVSVAFTNISIRFNLDDYNCPLNLYDYVCNGVRYHAFNETTVYIGNLKHYESYPIYVKKDGVTLFTYFHKTEASDPSEVQNLKIINATDSSISLSWMVPKYPNGMLQYVVEYNLYKYNFCKEYLGFDERPSLAITTNNTSITLQKLLPYTEYQITVSAITGENMKSRRIYEWANTSESAQLDDISEIWLGKTRPSAYDIQGNIKLQVNSCEKIKGTFCYKIICNGTNVWDLRGFVQDGNFTSNNNISHNVLVTEFLFGAKDKLTPFSKYNLNATIFRCQNPRSSYKMISTTYQTSAQAPPPIIFAEIYANDQSKIHLRWKQPYPPFGELEMYILRNPRFNSIEIIEKPKPCKLWEGYICHEYSRTKYWPQIAIKNKGVETFSPYTFFKRCDDGIPSEPRNLSVSLGNNMQLEVTWLHPLYPRSSTLSIFDLKLDNKTIEKKSFGNKKEYKYPISNWANYCGKSISISISAVKENNQEIYSVPASTYYLLPSCENLIVEIPDTEELKKFLNNSLIIKIPTENYMQYTSNLVILARSENADKIPNFKFDNCSSFVKYQNVIFNKITKQVVKVKNAERCWNISVKQNRIEEWIIYNKTNHTLKETSSINVDLFIMNSRDQSYHYVIRDFKLKADVSPSDDKSNLMIWVLILVIIIIILVLITIWYRRNIPTKINEFLSKLNSQFEDNQSYNSQMIPLTQSVKTLSLPRNTLDVKKFIDAKKIIANPIHISSFKQYVKEALETGELERQHKLFVRGQTKPWNYGVRPENKHKNRYSNLIAYDETRVILQKIDDDPFSDYINANYIDGYEHERAYIATQGPKAQTLNDFWRMIWQEGSIFIIMLANIRESGKKKCEQYWPNINEEIVYGNISVIQEDSTMYADYVCRKFKVTLNGESRQVEQFHFVSWPDHGVPMYAKSLLPLARKLHSIPYETPIVIHCSAGVGRTGTIILSDIMFRMASKVEQVDVLYYLKQIRDQRPNLVDNSDQYILVHLIIIEGLLTQQTNIPCEKLEQRFETLLEGDYIGKQMAQIDECSWMNYGMTKPSQRVTFNDNTKEKNRFSDIVPIYTNDLIYLTPQRDEEGSEYINAVFVDGYRRKEKFIVTQQPLPNTLGDFWRLVVEQDIKFIVSLNKFNPNNETVADICPPVNCEICPMPYLKIKYIRKTNCAFYCLIIVQINCNSQFINASQDDFCVQIIQLKQWCALAPLPKLSKRDVIQFWQDVNKICEDNTTLVTCYDGALASGLFTALSFIIEQIDFEHECDISLAVRTIRHNRPNFVRSEEQFKYLYEIAISYVDSFSTYSNFQT